MNDQLSLGTRIRIGANDETSSDRTRAKVLDNGSSGFLLEKVSEMHPVLKGPAVLVRSVAMSHDGSAWFGWLPIDEIDIVKWS
jgi:hypothetical protein